MVLLAAAAAGSGDHLSISTFYGWDPAALAAMRCNVFRAGDVDALLAATKQYGVKGMVDGPGVFVRGNWLFESGGLVAGWQAKVAEYVSKVTPGIADGSIIAVDLGDELVCSGVPLANLTAVADALRAALPSVIRIYTNECSHTLQGCYKSTCKDEWAWPRVPASLDWISADLYNAGNSDGAEEVATVQREYRNVIYPKLSPRQGVLIVPGVYANSPEQCSEYLLRCPVAAQEEQVVRKLRGFLDWARNDTRVVGFNYWHLNNRSAPQSKGPYDKRLGAVAMPRVADAVRDIGDAVSPRR